MMDIRADISGRIQMMRCQESTDDGDVKYLMSGKAPTTAARHSFQHEPDGENVMSASIGLKDPTVDIRADILGP